MKNFMVLGKYPVIEAIKSNTVEVIKVYILSQNLKYLQKLNYNNFEVVEKKFFKKIVNNQDILHQGFAAKIIKKSSNLKSLIKSNSNIVLLDGVNDPRNQGSIIRNCLAFNVKDIIIEKKIYKEDSFVMHITACGATMNTRIYIVSNLNNIIKDLKNNDFHIFGLDNSGKISIEQFNFNSDKNVFIFGSEGYGMRKNISKKCDTILKININDDVESLNVSNASAISLYELNKKKPPVN